MAYSTIANLATGNVISETWVDGVRTNQEHLHDRYGWMWVYPAVEWDGSTYYATPLQAHGSRVATSRRPIGSTQYVFFNFIVPSDFSAIALLKVYWLPSTTQTVTVECVSSYAASGESYTTHTGTVSSGSMTQTAAYINSFDASGAFSSLAANDFAGARVRPTSYPSGGDFGALGLLFAWERT